MGDSSFYCMARDEIFMPSQAMRDRCYYVFTVSLSVPMSRTNMDSPALQTSPLHTCSGGGII